MEGEGDGDYRMEDTMNNYPENLREVLLYKWTYKPLQVDGVITKLEAMRTNLQDAFSKYMATDEFPNSPKCFGLSPLDIANNYPFKPPAVFLMMEWILEEPMQALDFLVEEYRKPLPGSFDPKELHGYLVQQATKQETTNK